MKEASIAGPPLPDARGLATTREHFLTAESPSAGRVRPTILASWQRSRDHKIAPDKIEMPYLRDPDGDTKLSRSAEPILRRLHEQLDGQSVSIVLTDPTGLVLSRRTGDPDLERYLDLVQLAPGFSYAEQFVGTNGIGTALEAGEATAVFGHEHYAEHLELLACAGVPIQDPTTGRTVGAVDLTCWRKDAESLLVTLARNAAEQIRQALLVDSGMQEFEVFQAYRRTCRRMTGIVFALTSDAVMLNDHARAVLEPADQAALLAHASHTAEDLAPGRHRSVAVTLPTGAAAQMYCEQVDVDAAPAGLVVHVKLGLPDAKQRASIKPATPMLLPGLVGDTPPWKHACQSVESAFRAGDWLAVQGEAGVGKFAMLRAVQLRRQPTNRLAVLDGVDQHQDPLWAAALRAAVETADSVVIRHVDVLDPGTLRSLAATLQDAQRARNDRLWVAVTARRFIADGELASLMRLFPTTVVVPPLRLHLQDLSQLVTFFLAKLGHGSKVSCSAEAMRLLMRSPWPGNIEQLQKLLSQVLQYRRTGVIRPEDLPPEAQTVSRRVLTQLESIERDAIVTSLADLGGNKLRAARALGMSRATIYRKIHEYGIVSDGQ